MHFIVARMPDSDPQINLTVISFPTDKLTIKALRLRLAGEGAYASTRKAARLGEGVVVSINSEPKLAQWAFDEALGRAIIERHPGERDEIRETLAAEYTDFLRIATGDHHAVQLIRELEKAAADQARTYLRGRRP
jgi:hypothetical protein